MKKLNIGPKNFQSGVVPILGFLLLWSLSSYATPAVAKQPLFDAYRRIIVLDPGHGGRDIGARGAEGTVENAVALELAKLMTAELQRDYKVTLTRTDDYHLDLDHRTALANHLKADVFVSLHTGGSLVYGTAGTIIYYYQNVAEASSIMEENPVVGDYKTNRPIEWGSVQNSYRERSLILARMISSRLSTMNSIKHLRIQGAPLAVLKGAQMPAILIEAGYLTNPAEEKNLRNNRFLMDIATEISKGIKDFLSRTD